MSTKHANDRLITVHAPAFHVLAIAGNQKCLINMAINLVGRKFENNLQTALKESLAFFPVDELKAEHGAETYNEKNLVICKSVAGYHHSCQLLRTI